MKTPVTLAAKGRLLPERPSLEELGSALLIVQGHLIVSAFDTAKRRSVALVYAIDGQETWKKAAEFELPLDCSEVADFRTWTTTSFLPWGPGRARICVRHRLLPSGDAKTDARESSWVGDLTFDPIELTPRRSVGIPRCCFEDTEVSLLGSALHVTSGENTFTLEDPDADKISRFGETTALANESSIWVSAPGTYSEAFEPRLHEFDRRSGALKRTVRLGGDARPSLGWEACFWNDGILLSAGNAGQAAYVPLRSSEPVVLLRDESWESAPHGYSAGQTCVCTLGTWGVVAARYGEGGRGAIVFMPNPAERWTALTGKDTQRGIGNTVAAESPWLVTSSPYADGGGVVHVVRASNDRVEPANVIQVIKDKATIFEELYPGFLRAPKVVRSKFTDWQLKAAIYSCLIAEGHLPPFSLRQFCALHPKKKIDPEQSKLVKDAVTYLRFWEESEAVLDKLETLTFDGGNRLYQELYPCWDGEDSTFDVKNLAGIELCRGLERIDLGSNGGRPDLEPLLSLPKLKELRLPLGGGEPRNERILTALREAGVRIL